MKHLLKAPVVGGSLAVTLRRTSACGNAAWCAAAWSRRKTSAGEWHRRRSGGAFDFCDFHRVFDFCIIFVMFDFCIVFLCFWTCLLSVFGELMSFAWNFEFHFDSRLVYCFCFSVVLVILFLECATASECVCFSVFEGDAWGYFDIRRLFIFQINLGSSWVCLSQVVVLLIPSVLLRQGRLKTEESLKDVCSEHFRQSVVKFVRGLRLVF